MNEIPDTFQWRLSPNELGRFVSKKVLEALTVKYSKVQKGVGNIMGGKILDYEVKQVRNEELKKTARNLFKNGASYELVRASIEVFSDEELQAIYKEAKEV